jgi:phosphoglycolate phosphatase
MHTTLIFDLDGTLADSADCIVTSMHLVAKHFGWAPVSDKSIQDLIGKSLSFMFPSLYNTPDDKLQSAIERYRVEYVRLTETEEKLFDGVIPLLEDLQSMGFKMAIATGKNQAGAEHACNRLGLAPYFDSIHGILPGTPGKPDPAVLIRAMKALGSAADECVMIGDTIYDMQLAQAVDVRAIGVAWGVHSRDKLEGCGVKVMGDVLELLSVLIQSLSYS